MRLIMDSGQAYEFIPLLGAVTGAYTLFSGQGNELLSR